MADMTLVVNNEVTRVIQAGVRGATGATGATGAAGLGVPAGGTTGQVLGKASGTNYDTQWTDAAEVDAATIAALIEATTPTPAASLDATDRAAVTVDTALGSVTLDVLLDALLRVAAAGGVLTLDGTAGKLVVRQRGGTAGTHEVQVSHDGTRAVVESKAGGVRVKVPSATLGDVLIDSPDGGNPGVTATGGNLALGAADRSVLFCNVWSVNAGSGALGSINAAYPLAFGSRAGLSSPATKVVELNDLSSAGATLRSVPLTPSQITSDQNNYAPGVARFYRLSTDASRTLTGLSVGQVDGQECWVINVGTNNLVLAHQSASSTATNRFDSETGADITVPPKARVSLLYDATASRWLAYPSKTCT